MKIIWYPIAPPFIAKGPFRVACARRDTGVIEIKCTFVAYTGFTQSGYNIARVEDVPLDQYDTVAENVRLMAEMGLYEQAL